MLCLLTYCSQKHVVEEQGHKDDEENERARLSALDEALLDGEETGSEAQPRHRRPPDVLSYRTKHSDIFKIQN